MFTNSHSQVKVIVLFADIEGADAYFNALNNTMSSSSDAQLKSKIRNITYIGSESWSTQQSIFSKFHGKLFTNFVGVGVFKSSISGFHEYLQTLNETHYNDMYNNFDRNYFLDMYNSGEDRSAYLNTIANLDDHSSTTSDAAYAFGIGLREYIRTYNLSNTHDTNTTQLFNILKKTNITSLTQNQVSFGSDNRQVGRYVIVHYTNGTFHPAGHYTSEKELQYDNPYSSMPSICSAKCGGGQYKRSTSPCCHECMNCSHHMYSNGSGVECARCAATYTHNIDHTACVPVPPTILPWVSLFSVILYVLIVAGLVVVVFVMAVFYSQFNTPVVQGHGIFIYTTLLASCVFLFASTLLFVGEPTDTICNLQIAVPIIGVSTIFLCTICLTKSMILKLRQLQIHKFYLIQLTILVVGVVVQIILVSVVLYFKPRVYEKEEMKRGVVYGKCVAQHSSSNFHYIDSVLYAGTFSISLTSLVLSFIGRNINENYNEGKFLAFQSIAMHIVIAAFIPTINVLTGPMLGAAWAVACIILSFIVLIVFFVPKLYIIIYRPYKNTFMDDVIPESALVEVDNQQGDA